MKYLEVGVKKVIIFVLVFDEDIIIVMGVNEDKYDVVNYNVILNVFCIINCLVLFVKVLNDKFGFKCGMMIIVYFYIND